MEEIGTAGGRLFNSIKNTFFWKREVPKEIKTQAYKKVVIPIIYGAETWTITDKLILNTTKMRFIRKIENKTRRDKIRNATHRQNLKLRPIEKIEERQLR